VLESLMFIAANEARADIKLTTRCVDYDARRALLEAWDVK
jgi:hypothetical protein